MEYVSFFLDYPKESAKCLAIKTFFETHPSVRADVKRKDLEKIDLGRLSNKIEHSRFLTSTFSMKWLVKNYTQIILGKYTSHSDEFFKNDFADTMYLKINQL